MRARRVVMALLAVLVGAVWLVAPAAAAPAPTPTPNPFAGPGARIQQQDQQAPPAPAAPAPAATQEPAAPGAAATPAPAAPTEQTPQRPGYSFNNPNAGSGGGILADACRNAPKMELPGQSFYDVIAFGDTTTNGMFARYRFAGWDSHLYNPGCKDAVVGALARYVGGTPGMAGQAMTEEGGPNRGANIALGSVKFTIAVIVLSQRLGLGQYPLIVVVDQVVTALQVVFGQTALVLALTIGVTVTLCWLMMRRGMDFGQLGVVLWRVAAISGLAVVLMAWSVSFGTMYDSMVNETSRVTSVAAVGQDSPGAPADVTADALFHDVYMPLWGAVHLGWDPDAISRYAERLHAASAATVEEANRVRGNADATEQLAEAKARDYDAVAAEIKSSHPAAYTWLEGKDAGQRVLFAVMLALGILSAGVIVVGLSVVVFAARILMRIGVGMYPVLAAGLQFPLLHRWGIGIPALVLRWAAYGVAAVVVQVVYVRVMVVTLLVNGGGSVWTRLAALVLVNVALIVGWVCRDKLATKFGALSDAQQLRVTMEAGLNRLEHSITTGRQRFEQGRDGLHRAQDKLAPPIAKKEAKPDPTRPQPEPGQKKAPAAKRAVAKRAVTDAAIRKAARVAPPQARPAVLVASAVARRSTRKTVGGGKR